MVLYVYAIQQRHQPPQTYVPAFHAASKCQLQISSIAIQGSLAQRYGLVLQELRLELLRHSRHLRELSEQQAEGMAGPEVLLQDRTLPLDHSTAIRAEPVDLAVGQIGLNPTVGNDGLCFADNSPGSSILHVTGWGQFDSLVGLSSHYFSELFT